MKIQALVHVVIKVRDQAVAENFYHGILGLPIAARLEKPQMTFFSLGNHHDFAISVVGEDATSPPDKSIGLAHVAFKIGDSLEALREVKAQLDKADTKAMPIDHEVTKSLYFMDPDGNQVELYADVSDVWKEDPQTVAQGKALEI